MEHDLVDMLDERVGWSKIRTDLYRRHDGTTVRRWMPWSKDVVSWCVCDGWYTTASGFDSPQDAMDWADTQFKCEPVSREV